MKRKLLIIGFGSAGQRFAKIIKEKFRNIDIFVLTKQKNIRFNKISNLSEIKNLNPNFIIISSPTKLHFDHLKFVNNIFRNKKIFVEKPLFHKLKNIKNIKNNISVGFNMRNLKIIKFLKEFIKKNKKKIYEISFINHSYLPNWRKNIDYRNSSSAKKKYAGGVILDCSHEIDLAKWTLGEIDLFYVSKSKNSKLKIDTEDNCKIYGKHKRIKIFIDLNYYSIQKYRKINVFGENFKMCVDLIAANVLIYKNSKIFKKKFDVNDLNNSYYLELKYFLTNKKNFLTNYNSALSTQKFIQQIIDF